MARIHAHRRPTVALVVAAGAVALLTASSARAQVVHLGDVLAAHPVPADPGASVTEVLRGASSSVNVWQITGSMPAHLHREHEEVIVVRSGRARAQIGEQTLDLGPGDVVLVPRNTVHGARALGEEPMVGFSVFAPAFDGKDRVPMPAATAAPADESGAGSR
jgi:quercetin dioxygenase-like cupin family protein